MTKEKSQETLENETEKLKALYKEGLELEGKLEGLYRKLLSLQDEIADRCNDVLVELEQLNK